jgi:hypothetical protein
MIKTEAGGYRNELGQLYLLIQFYEKDGDEKYRELQKISSEDYLFCNVEKLPLFQERYNFSELKEIMSVTSKGNLKKANSLIGKINIELENKSENCEKFKSLMNELCISLDGRCLKT